MCITDGKGWDGAEHQFVIHRLCADVLKLHHACSNQKLLLVVFVTHLCFLESGCFARTRRTNFAL